GVRGAGRSPRPGHRAGFDAQAGRTVLGPTVGGVATTVSAHSAEYDTRLLPPAESARHLDYADFQPVWHRPRGRERSAGNSGRGRRLAVFEAAGRTTGADPSAWFN